MSPLAPDLGLNYLVSRASNGTQGNNFAGSASISADGRYITFQSYADNLVPNNNNYFCDIDFDGDFNDNCMDVFVHDRLSGSTTLISASTAGVQGIDRSDSSAISADGRFVAFTSFANNLVASDTNNQPDIFVHDMTTGATERISLHTDGTQANGASDFPSISADGHFVAFASFANNLVSGDTNSVYDVFVRDRWTNTTQRVSVSSSGLQGFGLHQQKHPFLQQLLLASVQP